MAGCAILAAYRGFLGDMDIDIDIDVEVDADTDRYFGCLKGGIDRAPFKGIQM